VATPLATNAYAEQYTPTQLVQIVDQLRQKGDLRDFQDVSRITGLHFVKGHEDQNNFSLELLEKPNWLAGVSYSINKSASGQTIVFVLDERHLCVTDEHIIKTLGIGANYGFDLYPIEYSNPQDSANYTHRRVRTFDYMEYIYKTPWKTHVTFDFFGLQCVQHIILSKIEN
jgi:hypothetical protein